MKAAAQTTAAFRFHVDHNNKGFDCIVTDDAIQALGASANALSVRHRRFLEGIAAERIEWSRRPQRTIIIDAWDIATHSQG